MTTSSESNMESNMSFLNRYIKNLAKKCLKSNDKISDKSQQMKTCKQHDENCYCELFSFLKNDQKKRLSQKILTIREKSIQLQHIFDAIVERDDVQLKRLLLGNSWYDINSWNEDGITALHFACIVGSEQCVITLLENGACKFMEDIRGRSPLHYAKLMERENCKIILERAEQLKLSASHP